jgi:hypothetical protein
LFEIRRKKTYGSGHVSHGKAFVVGEIPTFKIFGETPFGRGLMGYGPAI